MSFRAERENATAVSKWPQRSNITSEAAAAAAYELKFELPDLDNLSSHVSLASKCHNSQNIGTLPNRDTGPLPAASLGLCQSLCQQCY